MEKYSRAGQATDENTRTGCGRNNSHILKVNKNQTKQGIQKIILFIKSTYDAICFQIHLKITSLKCRPLLMTISWSLSRKLSMALRVIAGGMAATSCRIASFNCSIVPGRRTCWGFFLSPFKNPTASAGFEPANLGIRGQHATSAPPKPLFIK